MALRLDLIDLCGIDRHELIPAILILPLKGDNLFVGVSTQEISLYGWDRNEYRGLRRSIGASAVIVK